MKDFTQFKIDAVYRALRERRNMRHFLPDPVFEDVCDNPRC